MQARLSQEEQPQYFFPGQKHTTYYYYYSPLHEAQTFFLQINIAASILDCSNIYRRIILPQMC